MSLWPLGEDNQRRCDHDQPVAGQAEQIQEQPDEIEQDQQNGIHDGHR